MESKVHQMIWFQSGKCSYYSWNQFRIVVYSNLQNRPPGNWNRPKILVNHKIAPLTRKIASVEDQWSKQSRTFYQSTPYFASVFQTRLWITKTRIGTRWNTNDTSFLIHYNFAHARNKSILQFTKSSSLLHRISEEKKENETFLNEADTVLWPGSTGLNQF